jgi:hypothetical protein
VNARALLFGLAAAFCAGTAHARTATYVAPADIDDRSLYALNHAGDKKGFLVGLNQILAIVFDAKFASVKNADTISIFTLAPSVGTAKLTISFGVWNNGAPIIVSTTNNLNAGQTLNLGNLFQSGCSVFGGCDYIAITTKSTTKGAAGAVVDHVDVNGQIVEIASPTPEPTTWALMILGFCAVAARLKAARRRSFSTASA